MSTVDSHVHVWDPSLHRHAWLDAEPALNRAVLPADIGFAAAGVDRAVFVQADAAESVGEAAWVASLDWPQLAGIVAHAPLERSDAAEVLDQLAGIPLVIGVRRLLQDESREFFASQALAKGLAEVARRELTFDACVRHGQLHALYNLARSVPDLSVVIDHLGKPPVADGLYSDAGVHWLTAMAALAELDGVTVKLSGLAPEANPTSAIGPQARPFLHVAVELFGVNRCMVGSDWPVSGHTKHSLGYAEWFSLVLDGLSLSKSEQASIAADTASRVYGLTPAKN